MNKPKLKAISGWLQKGKIAIAVGKTVITGKPARTFDHVERGLEIGEKALEIADLVKRIFQKKP